MVERCPVCNGKGIVQNGFYSSVTGYTISTTTAFETCRSCYGKGYIIIPDYSDLYYEGDMRGEQK